MNDFRCIDATPRIVISIFVILMSIVPIAHAESSEHGNQKKKPELTFGFFPIISTVTLFKRFAPLRDYLSDELNRPVVLQTAKNFPTFMKRTDARSYDIVVTAPHFALKAADSGLYTIRATLTSDVQQLVIVRADSSITNIRELKGKLVASPPEKALMTMMGIQYFSEVGLSGDSGPVFRSYNSHNAANEAVIAGEADAAIASSNIVKKAIKQGAPLRVIGKGLQFPNMATMVASDIDSELADKLVNVLVEMKNNKAGQQVLKQIAFPGYREVSAAEYELVRPYLEKTIKQ